MWLALCLVPAHAQDPAPAPEAEPVAAPEAPATPADGLQPGAVRWAATATTAQRFPDAATPTWSLEKDDKVDVVFVEGERARVKKGASYGWVAKSVLTEVAPVSAAPEPSGLDLLTDPSLTAPIQLDAPSLSEGIGAGANDP